jgi:hypothetical protein
MIDDPTQPGTLQVSKQSNQATPGRLPDFIIIGAQRCGTSSLYSYLIQHPQIAPAARKELHYFDLNYAAGNEWYRSQFPDEPFDGRLAITGEASPYYLFHPMATERCASVVPDAKLIVMVRDPVKRAYSHYHHEVRKGRETLTFEEAIDREPERLAGERDKLIADPNYKSQPYQSYSYLARGLYTDQLKTWRKYFATNQILAVSSDLLFENADAEYSRVLEFLQIDPIQLPEYRQRNAGHYEPMAEQTRERLNEYFEPSWREMQALLANQTPADSETPESH